MKLYNGRKLTERGRMYMAGKRNVDFKVLDAISVVSKKLSGSELKIKRTKEFTQAEEKLTSYFGITSGDVWIL